MDLIKNAISYLLSVIVTTDSNDQVAIQVSTDWEIPIGPVWELCSDYRKFIDLMLDTQQQKPNTKWTEGSGPGKVGGVVAYTYENKPGNYTEMVEKVTQLTPHTLGYLTVSFTPDTPFMKHHHCLFQLEKIDAEHTHVKWTRVFDNPKILGFSVKSLVFSKFSKSMSYILDKQFRHHFGDSRDTGCKVIRVTPPKSPFTS